MATSGGASSGGNGRDTAVIVAQITAASTILVAIISCFGGLIITFIDNPPASPTATNIPHTATPTQAPIFPTHVAIPTPIPATPVIIPTEEPPSTENIIFTISQCINSPDLLAEVNVYIDSILIGRLSNVTSVSTLTAYVFTEGRHSYYLEVAYGYYNPSTGLNETVNTFPMYGEAYFTQDDNLIICHSAPDQYPSVYLE